MKEVYLAWQDLHDRSWYPIGRLTRIDSDGEKYQFVYTKGAKLSPRFTPLGNMKDLCKRYESTELFPLFANRILSRTRPEYRKLLDWLDLAEGQDDPLQLLALTEGIRATDNLAVYPCPSQDKDGNVHVRFFSHGIRYLPPEAIARVDGLQSGTKLYLMPDSQNEHDAFAIALRTGDPKTIVGFCPRYLAEDFRQILLSSDPSPLVFVERVNRDAPIQFRLLCGLTSAWPEGFTACTGELYTPLA